MFGISFIELVVVMIVSMLIIEPKEFVRIFKFFIKTVSDLKELMNKAKISISQELDLKTDKKNDILDLNGENHKAYDVSFLRSEKNLKKEIAFFNQKNEKRKRKNKKK